MPVDRDAETREMVGERVMPHPCGRTNPHTSHGGCLGSAPEYPSEQVETVTEPRRCLYVPPTAGGPRGYIPSLVTEGEPGHSPMVGSGDHAAPWYWGPTLATAEAICDKVNAETFGLSRREALDIVTSSMAAQNRQETAAEERTERYDRLVRGREG